MVARFKDNRQLVYPMIASFLELLLILRLWNHEAMNSIVLHLCMKMTLCNIPFLEYSSIQHYAQGFWDEIYMGYFHKNLRKDRLDT